MDAFIREGFMQMKKQISIKNSNVELLTFGDRLRFLVGDEARRAFAQRCGFTHGAYFNGAVPTRKIMLSICAQNDVNLLWLAAGEGPIHPGGEVPPPPAWEKENQCKKEVALLL